MYDFKHIRREWARIQAHTSSPNRVIVMADGKHHIARSVVQTQIIEIYFQYCATIKSRESEIE